MRALKIVLALVLAFALVTAGGVFLLSRYVRSAAFRQAVLGFAHDTLGADVAVGEIDASLWSGATLRRLTVANPPEVAGTLLSADALVVRYHLLPLLRKRLELAQVSLERPVLRFSRDARGEWNYERVGPRPAAGTPRPAPRATAPLEASPPVASSPPLDLVVPRLAVTNGEVVFADASNVVWVRLRELDLVTSLSWVGHGLGGTGTARAGTLSVAEAVFLRRLTTGVTLSPNEVRLAPLEGKLAQGDVRGDVTLWLGAGSRYAAHLEVRDADVERLLQEAGAKRRLIRGRLQARGTLAGTGGVPTMVGRGQAEILGGALIDMPILNTVAILLREPSLRDLVFEECRVEFVLAGTVLETPVIRLIARDVQITGGGSIALPALSLDHQLTLAVTKGALDHAPREVRALFRERPDGFRTVDFRVWGPYDAPRTDLGDPALTGVAGEVLRRGLRKLLR